MSQSDYCHYLRISTELRNRKLAKPIIDENDYVEFKEYSLQNTVLNKSISFNELIPSGKRIIYGIEKISQNCPICVDFPTNNIVTKPHLLCINSNQAAIRPMRPIIIKNPSQKNNCTFPCVPSFT